MMQTIQRTRYTLSEMQKARIDLFKLAHECCADVQDLWKENVHANKKNLNIILSSYQFYSL